MSSDRIIVDELCLFVNFGRVLLWRKKELADELSINFLIIYDQWIPIT